MHPIFRSRNTVLAYLAAWIPLAIMYRATLSFAAGLGIIESIVVTVPLVLTMALICLFPWYSCRYLPLGSVPLWRVIAIQIIPAMFFSGAVLAVMHMFVDGLNRSLPRLRIGFSKAIPTLAGLIFLTYLLSIALHYVVLAVEASRQAELLSREAQLKALKAQVNPHFLFNSLNSISALTGVDGRRAREMCVRLSDFLRTSLRLGEQITVNLKEELNLARAYLDVEQVRFGNRLQIQQHVDEKCMNCELPSLIVQPLVENAIKHGIATLVEGGEIRLEVSRTSPDLMRITIENPFDPDAPVTGKSGFGLVNVRNRLQARYGNGARLAVQVEKDKYRVSLFIPCICGKSLL